eukprot:scaffold634_cov401-Prasinococcus_capsulatus_cf.AAC.7
MLCVHTQGAASNAPRARRALSSSSYQTCRRTVSRWAYRFSLLSFLAPRSCDPAATGSGAGRFSSATAASASASPPLRAPPLMC